MQGLNVAVSTLLAAADPIGALVAILGALSGLGGLVLGFFVWHQSRRRDEQQNQAAERSVVVEERTLGQDLSDSLLGRQGEWIERQSAEIREQEKELRALKDDLAVHEVDNRELRILNTRLRLEMARYKALYGELPDE